MLWMENKMFSPRFTSAQWLSPSSRALQLVWQKNIFSHFAILQPNVHAHSNVLQKLVFAGLKYYILKANILDFSYSREKLHYQRSLCQKMKGNFSPWSPLQN